MQIALVDGQRVLASPKAIGKCPGCQGEVIAKCGTIKVWHWAHVGKDCDPWSEGETEWHRAWKERFPVECREVVMGPHRADICINGTVIELQHSSISVEEIQERERFYGRMLWIFDAAPFQDRIRFDSLDNSFTWRWPRQSLTAIDRPLVFDTSSGLFYVKTLFDEPAGHGVGVFVFLGDIFKYVDGKEVLNERWIRAETILQERRQREWERRQREEREREEVRRQREREEREREQRWKQREREQREWEQHQYRWHAWLRFWQELGEEVAKKELLFWRRFQKFWSDLADELEDEQARIEQIIRFRFKGNREKYLAHERLVTTFLKNRKA